MKHSTTYKVKEIPTSADLVGERKAYRMTGNLQGTKSKETAVKKSSHKSGHKMKSHNPY